MVHVTEVLMLASFRLSVHCATVLFKNCIMNTVYRIGTRYQLTLNTIALDWSRRTASIWASHTEIQQEDCPVVLRVSLYLIHARHAGQS